MEYTKAHMMEWFKIIHSV